MRSKLLYLHGVGEIGGAERALLAVLDKLDRDRWAPVVACPAEGLLLKEVKDRGISVYPMLFPAWRKLNHLWKRLPASWKLSNLLHDVQPAFVHVNDMYWVPQAVRAAERAKVPVVTTIRQNIRPGRVRQYELHRAVRLIVLSRSAYNVLVREGLTPERIRIIPSGVDVDWLTEDSCSTGMRGRLGIPGEAPVIGCLANVLEIKGQDILLHAFADVAKSYPNAHLLLVGRDTSPFGAQMRALADRLGIGPRTHFAGFQADVRPYLSTMTLMVLPSRSEGLPVALLEAMAMGIPVIASAVGGVPEVVAHGETGRLVEPENPFALGDAIREYLAHPDRLTEEGNRSKELVRRNYSIRAEVRALEELYRSLTE
jgi:glycosyltransferase involved in cell wall biosynthesis